jgi:hypothetical protein
MGIWLTVFAVMLIWGVLTALFWLESVRNVNALSIVANVGMAGAGIQGTLAMRKADNRDRF